jgi:4-oxalocrotonate tautomerase
MPLVHISLRAGKPEAYRQAIFDGVYQALRDTFNVPDDDQFMAMTEHDAANFRYGATYLDVARSDDVVFIQITASNTRGMEQKKALFRRIAQRLGARPGMREEDVFVSLVACGRGAAHCGPRRLRNQ